MKKSVSCAFGWLARRVSQFFATSGDVIAVASGGTLTTSGKPVK